MYIFYFISVAYGTRVSPNRLPAGATSKSKIQLIRHIYHAVLKCTSCILKTLSKKFPTLKFANHELNDLVIDWYYQTVKNETSYRQYTVYPTSTLINVCFSIFKISCNDFILHCCNLKNNRRKPAISALASKQ